MGRYDAIFGCGGYGNPNGPSYDHGYHASTVFYDDSGQPYRVPPKNWIPPDISVLLNGDTLKQGMDERVRVHFPEPLTWRITGNDRYPSVVHTIATDSIIEYLSPREGDSVSLSHGFEITYRAPQSIDTVLIHLMYIGNGVYKRDTTKTEETGQSYYYKVPNTGQYVIPPFEVRDQFKSLTPERLYTFVMWDRGDTVHVGQYVYGFTTEYYLSRKFNLKR